MPATDARPGEASQTTPGAIRVDNRIPVAGWPSQTPRFGWIYEPGSPLVTHTYRFVAENAPPEAIDAVGSEWVADFAVDARVRVLTDDPRATETAGVGYRSSLQHLDPDLGTAGLWSSGDLVDAAAKFASHYVKDLAGSVLHEPANSSLVRAMAALTALHAELRTNSLDPDSHTAQWTPWVGLSAAKSTVSPAVTPLEQAAHVGAVRWLEEHAGLSQGAIADLVGVSRQTVRNWLGGVDIRDENRQRLLAVRDILERIQRRHRGSDALMTWLDTPRGPQAQTPRQLLIANEIGTARALSLSTAPPRPRSAPAWLRKSPPDPWTDRQRRRRERVVPDESGEDQTASPESDGRDRG